MVSTNGAGRMTGREIASVDRDYSASFNAYGRYFLQREDAAILAKGKGKRIHEIFRDTARDAKVAEGLAQRFGAVLARELVVEPASESRLDKKVADEVRSQINSLNRRNTQALNTKGALYSFGGFDAFTSNMLDAIYMGYSIGEINWVAEGSRVKVGQIWNRDQSRFIFNVANGGYELRLLTQQSPIDGEELPARKFLVNTHGSNIGNPYGEPLAEKLFWWVFFKRSELKFWLTFSDKYGSPTLKGTYDNERQRDRLLEIMSNVAQQAGIALPRGVELDLLAAATSHTSTYQDLCAYCDGQMTAAILLQNLTTNVQGGSYAAAETHFEVRSELTDADASALSSGPYNDLATWITEYNFGIDATPPLVYKPRVRTPDEARARRDQILVGLVGRPLSENYLKTFYDAEFKTPEEVAKEQATASAIAPKPEESPFAFTETVDFKTATPTKQRTCSKGFACGGSCIAKGKKCKQRLDEGTTKAADYLDKKVPGSKTTKAKTPKNAKTEKKPKPAAQDKSGESNQLSSVAYDDQDFETWRSAATPQLVEISKRKKAGGELTEQDQRVRDNYAIFTTVMSNVRTGDEKDFRGLKDKDGNLQVAALVKQGEGKYLYLDYLVTAPWNVLGGDGRSQKGGGTAMMRQIVQESIAAGHGGRLKLTALSGARGFYEKIGFKVTASEDDFTTGGMTYKMELSPESATEFLKKTGG